MICGESPKFSELYIRDIGSLATTNKYNSVYGEGYEFKSATELAERIRKTMEESVMKDVYDKFMSSGCIVKSKPVLYATSSRYGYRIVDVNVIVPNKVVEITFADGDKQKSVCSEPDVFSLEQAISICITKHLLGGTGKYNKAIKDGMKVYEDKLATEKFEKAEEERIAKKRAKREAYKKRKAEKRKEEQIEIQKEAYVRAMEYMQVRENK